MFATLAGDLPVEPGPGSALGRVLAAQVEAGLGIISDGSVHDEPADAVLAAWAELQHEADALRVEMPLKLAVLGPWARASAEERTDGRVARAGREVPGLRRALADLAAAGCTVVEIHEPAATMPATDDESVEFVETHRQLLAGAPPALHATLAITGGEAGLAGMHLPALPYQSVLLDLLDGPDGWRIITSLPGDRGVILGVGDATGRRRTSLETIAWAVHYASSTHGRGTVRVGVAPSRGLGTLDPEAARVVIAQLGEAVRLLSGDPDELLHTMDPRAIDIRSAALGRFAPDPRSRRGP